MATRCILYGRAGCHLCEEALDLLRGLGLEARVVDIDGDAGLGGRYGLRIPVLVRPDGAELDWPFDAERVLAWLGEGAGPGQGDAGGP